MEAAAAIRFTKGVISFRLSHLQAAELAAGQYGFFDIDVEPTGVGGVSITASAKNRKVSVKGRSMEEAVERLLEVFSG